MCVCGGIIEIGAISALVGFIGKRLHNCKCKCHEPIKEECSHCHNHNFDCEDEITKPNVYPQAIIDKKHKKYKIIQYILGGIMFAGLLMTVYGLCKHFSQVEHKHTEYCVHRIEYHLN